MKIKKKYLLLTNLNFFLSLIVRSCIIRPRQSIGMFNNIFLKQFISKNQISTIGGGGGARASSTNYS